MFNEEQIGLFTRWALMAAGGFAAGYLLTWLACLGFDKTIVKGKSPDGLHKWARRIGGVVVSLVVAFLLFPRGSGNGGNGNENNTGTATGPTTQQTTQTPNTTPLPPKVEVDATPVYVTVYAGKEVSEGKFYALGDPPGGKVKLDAVSEKVQAAVADKKNVLLVYTLDDTATTTTTGFYQLEGEAKRLSVGLVSKAEFDKLRRK